MELRGTLSLPDPEFTIPMKADLAIREPQMQKRWDEMGLYRLIQDARRGAPKFILHDGPPYTNSPTHIGTALNKSLKDFVVRYKTMRGYHCPYVPGYDTHGLPIELAVQAPGEAQATQSDSATSRLNEQRVAPPLPLGPSEMRAACRKHAEGYIAIQTEQFKRFGVLGDWEHPYATMDYGYEAAIIRAFAELARQGFIYRDLKPTHWSTYSRTALAETELVYEEHTSRAIYARFPLRRDKSLPEGKGVLTQYAPLERIYTLIWTTTPWTIPGNLAVAFHPDLDYALVECEGDYYLLYDELVGLVFQEIGKPEGTKVAKIKGSDLEGVVFKHPIFDRDSVAVLADYVNTDEGTGVVHTAPGHGSEDFYTGRKYDLPIICPVDEAGFFTEEAGEFAGMNIRDADKALPQRLAELGHLLKEYDYRHSYPYSERDKHPVIFRTTEQWFLSVDHLALRERALEEIKKVAWFPRGGEARITAMIETRPDWCLSRQRVWGVGIPILYGAQSGRPVLDDEIMERAAKLVEGKGSAAWFEAPLSEILPKGYKHPETGETEFRKESDVLDVWFDSGITHLAVLDIRYESTWSDLEWPCDLYLEGSDQHRGWFNSSLITAVAIKGAAPYRQVLTHGFVVDEKGEKMSKSKGNVVEPVEAAGKYGADILRYWAASVDYSNDVPCGEHLLKQLGENYRRIRNTFRFLLANLFDYDPNGGHALFMDIDKWAVEQATLLKYRACAAYDRYDFSAALSMIHNFCLRELSSFCLDAIKDRMYCDPKSSAERRSAQATCHAILEILTTLIAPVLPHTAEEVYERIPLSERKPTVTLEVISPMSAAEAEAAESGSLVKRFASLLAFRERLFAKLESWKVESGLKDTQDVLVRLSAGGELVSFLQSFGTDLPNLLKVSWLEMYATDSEERFGFVESPHLKCDRCRLRRPDVCTVKDLPLCKRCASSIETDWA